jgi:hypothetical protein
MTGAIDLQRGGIDAQVAFERANVALNAKLTDNGPEGTFSVATPFPFTATVNAVSGNVDAALCGMLGSQGARVSGGLGSGLHIQFLDADADPNACTPPTTALTMAPIILAQAAPPADTGFGNNLTVGLRRLLVLAIISGLLFVFIPGLWTPVGATARTAPWSRLGLGLCLLIALPVVGVLLFMVGLSLGLWWFGLLVLLVFVCILAAGVTLTGVVAGAWLLQRIRDPRVPPIAAVAVGLLALTVLGLLPTVGAAVTVLAMIYGAGALLLLPRAVQTPAPALQPAAVVNGAVVPMPPPPEPVSAPPPPEPVPAAPPPQPELVQVADESQTNGVPAATEPTTGGA